MKNCEQALVFYIISVDHKITLTVIYCAALRYRNNLTRQPYIFKCVQIYCFYV